MTFPLAAKRTNTQLTQRYIVKSVPPDLNEQGSTYFQVMQTGSLSNGPLSPETASYGSTHGVNKQQKFECAPDCPLSSARPPASPPPSLPPRRDGREAGREADQRAVRGVVPRLHALLPHAALLEDGQGDAGQLEAPPARGGAVEQGHRCPHLQVQAWPPVTAPPLTSGHVENWTRVLFRRPYPDLTGPGQKKPE